ncbi:CvpA family protein [bacterium]|nr:CvpA family protein [bacterium]MBU1958828.1 CvpA family protein [bacterium]
MVDMIIVGLILFLAIRGLVNGFSKELFNFLALVGGVAVAARAHTPVAELINQQNILPAMNLDFQKFIGFAVILVVIWVIFSIVSSIITRFTSTEPGFISRILGYIVGVARYVFIFSLIVFGISNSDFLKENLSKHYDGSQLFAPMSNIGAQLLNMDEKQSENQKPVSAENNESNISSEANATDEVNLSMNMNKITLTERNSSNQI